MTLFRSDILPSDRGRQVGRIAIPTGLEFVLILGLGFINQVVVAGLGDTAVAAVGFANSINMMPFFFLGALGVGAGVVSARAFGGGLHDRVSLSVTTALVMAIGSTVVVTLPFLFFPAQILELTGASDSVIATGSSYLQIVLASLTLGVVSQVLSGVLRSVNRPKSPMVATIVTVLLNTPLAVLLVYGWGPVPAMGITGAAWATFITTTIKAAILLGQTFIFFDVADWKMPRGGAQWRQIASPILVLAWPMALTGLSWTSGSFVFMALVQQLGDSALAAIQVVFALGGVFVVANIGYGVAVTTLAGQAVGAGRPDLAKEWARYLMRLTLPTSIVFGLLYLASSLLLPDLFPELSPQALTWATTGIAILAATQPVGARIAVLASILPSGNDPFGILLGDIVGPFVVGIPVTIALAFFTPLGVLGAFIGRGAEDITKWLIFAWRAKKIQWDQVARRHLESVMPPQDARTGPISIV